MLASVKLLLYVWLLSFVYGLFTLSILFCMLT